MTRRWRIHEEALAEIDATIAWYDEQRAGLGLEFLAELRRTLGELRAVPGASAHDRSGTADGVVRRRRMRAFPYAVIFSEVDDAYVVLAVMHLRRRPGYWRSRVGDGG